MGLARGGIGGEGRGRITGEEVAAGVAVATDAVDAAVGTTVAAGATDAATEGLGLGMGVGDGRVLTDGLAAGVGATDVLTSGVAVAAAAAGALGVGLGFTLGELAGVALTAAAAVALGVDAIIGGVALVPGGTLVIGVGDGLGLVLDVVTGVGLAAVAVGAIGVIVAAGVAEVDVSSGLTNFFKGAFGGGVASVLILVRARSATERSAMVQPLSMLSSMTRSFTRRGRGRSRTSVTTGTEISSSSPRTVAAVSVFCRRSR